MQTTVDNKEVVSKNEVVYIATKPNIVPEILEEVSSAVTKNNLIISVAAGITTRTIEQVIMVMSPSAGHEI